ncbi:MAG: dihydrolipoyl dehydrogenase family protein, partial [Paracoccaceae bacterium]
APPRRRGLQKAWRRPARFDRNLVVIGAGATGLVSAYIAAAVKAKVTLVEKRRMGGDCLNTGCVPSKALIASARMAHRMRMAVQLGLSAAAPRIDFPAVMARVSRVIAEIDPNDSPERYRSLGVDVVEGEARIVDPWTVAIVPNDPAAPRRQLTTRAIVIAAGAEPRVPDIPGLDRTGYLTTETLWARLARLPAVPERFAILGGGPIGCELAQAFARLGSRVTLIEAADRLLAREDAEAAMLVRGALTRDGVDVLTGAVVRQAGRDGGSRWIEITAGATPRRIVFDELLIAVGRDARLSGYGLEELGIPAGKAVDTNEYLETIYPNIFAAGDAAGPFQLTHAGAHQAWFATVNALFGTFWRFRADYRVIPSAVFTDPEVARVGLTEAEAKAQGTGFEVTRYSLAGLDRAVADGATEGFVKVLTAPGRDRILGASIVGESAGELIAEFALAMRHRIGLNGILSTVHAYPTRAEANRFAAGEWRKAHVNPRLLGILERFHRWRRG